MNNIITEKYKPSMYTYWVVNDSSVILYNSFVGVESIKKYSNEQKNKVLEFLNKEEIQYDENSTLKSLIDGQYVVPIDYDETLLLNNLYLKKVNGNILHLVILPTERCNFRCRYCYESFTRGKMSDETINNIVKYVRKNISKYSGLRVSWFGGEPSLEIDTICKMSNEFIKICKVAKRRYWANITSNGYLIDLDNFIKLYKANVFNYQITIDGIEETHDQQRVLANGEKSFTKIIENLKRIKQNEMCKHWRITIRTNFSKPISEHINEYISFYNKNFGDDNRFTFFFRPAGNWGGEKVKSYSNNLLNEDGFAQVFQSTVDHNETLDITRHLEFLNPGGSMCLASSANTFLIDSAGTIRKCSCHLDDSNNSLGCLNSSGTLLIDKYNYGKWIQARWNDEKCKKCFFLPACLNAACPADYVLSRNDPSKCHVYEKKYIDYILLIWDKLGKIPEVNV